MNKALTLLLVGFFILAGRGFAQTPPPAEPVAPSGAPVSAAPVHHHDHFPEVHRAMRKLRGAKADLEKAAHDYGGHRTAAIGYIDQALAELQAALNTARSEHP